MKIEEIKDQALRDKINAQLGEPTAADKVAKFIAPETPNKADAKSERKLQLICESWLLLRGYLRLTAENAERQYNKPNTSVRGWFGHLNNAKRNPLMPDLFIFDTAGRSLLIELKVHDVWQPGQREMLNMGAWTCAWTLPDFEIIVKNWEVQGALTDEFKDWVMQIDENKSHEQGG